MEFADTGLPGVRISEPTQRRASFDDVRAARMAEGRRGDPRRKVVFKEAYDFYQDVLSERRRPWELEAAFLRESQTISDFPLLFGDILQRELLGNYAAYPVSWPAYVRRRSLPDATRQARRLAYDGLDEHMTSGNKAPDGTNGPEDNALAETGYLVGPLAVYERTVSINWKALLADDLGAFNDIPGRLATAARRTEEFLVAGLLCNSSGPDSSFFTTGHGNAINATNGAASTNPAFSVQGLIDAMNVWARMTNATTGEPIVVDGSTLVIPRQLDVQAQSVFNAIQIWMNKNGGDITGLANSDGIETRIMANNWVTNGLSRAVNPYLSSINSTNGTTAWYVVADPAKNRPAFEIDFLTGEEAPILLRLRANAERVGGGSADMFGSFEGGEIRFKVMHLLSVSQLDYHGALASNGTGS